MSAYNAPIIICLLRAGEVAPFPKVKHILIGLVAHSATIIENNLGVVVVKAVLDKLRPSMLIRLAFKKLTNERLRLFQVGSCHKNGIYILS